MKQIFFILFITILLSCGGKMAGQVQGDKSVPSGNKGKDYSNIEGASGMSDFSAMDSKAASTAKESSKKKESPSKSKQEPGGMEKQKSEALYMSADDSNSTASPVIARKMINSGRYVQPDIIRTYEFLNYFTFDYAQPKEGGLAVIPQLRLDTGKKDEYSLQIALRSKNKTLKEMQPFSITFLLDNSGSMTGDPLALAKETIIQFVKRLRPGDMISLVSINREPSVLLNAHVIGAGSVKTVSDLMKGIHADDITNLEKGIAAAYELAGKNYSSEKLNRVVLLSDGAANSGKTAIETIAKHSADADRQGIYLAGIGFGEGFNDSLMNVFTDKGRGAYLFIDSNAEITRVMQENNFISYFDLALKDVRLKMTMPAGWQIVKFHGEQISSKKEDVTPQYLAPNDQMIYQLKLRLTGDFSAHVNDAFEFEAEYEPIGGKKGISKMKASVSAMFISQPQILKGDAIVKYAEFLKEIKFPPDANREANVKSCENAVAYISEINTIIKDKEITDILGLLTMYKSTIQWGENISAEDKNSDTIPAALGISPNMLVKIEVEGKHTDKAIKVLGRLLKSKKLVPMEGYKFLVLSNGPAGNPHPSGSGQLDSGMYNAPVPEFMGRIPSKKGPRKVFDLYQVKLTLKAPANAKSFSFDFNYFSAEYPGFVKKNFNDTFYALIQAQSTNGGRLTNISFDPNNRPIEVDNNYFENEFHPIPNTGTGFDRHGSTGWLRTSWPIRGDENFTITFSIHDEGDAVYDSLAIIDNFKFHEYEATGTTDPLN